MSILDKASGLSRRKFLKRGGGAAGAAVATVAFPQISRAQTATLKMQSSWPAKDIYQDMARQYATRVEAMSGGRLKIDLLPVNAVVKYNQVQEACHKGVIDAGHTVSAYWYAKNKAASLFGAGPVFGANGSQILAWIHYGGGQELYRELVQDIMKLNIVGFFCMPMPTQPLGWFSEQIKSTDHIKGVKYRTVGLAADIMQGIGMKVTQLPGAELIPALERKAIEAFEYRNPTSDRLIGAQDVRKNYMMGSYHEAANFFEIIFNKNMFQSLAKELQAILEHGAEAASTANYGMAMDSYSKSLQTLIKKDNVKVSRTPDAIMSAQLASWDKVLAKLTVDPFFKKVVDSQKAWAHRVAYYDLNNAANYKLAFKHYFPGEIKF